MRSATLAYGSFIFRLTGIVEGRIYWAFEFEKLHGIAKELRRRNNATSSAAASRSSTSSSPNEDKGRADEKRKLDIAQVASPAVPDKEEGKQNKERR